MTLIKKTILLAASFTLSMTLNAAEKKALSFSTTEVASGIYMLKGVGGFTGGNIGLSIGKDGVVMIDDSMPPMLDIMKKAIKSITDKPVDYLINTHVHGDHTGNNEAMGKANAKIVAHENLREHLVKKGIATREGYRVAPDSALPVITFSHNINFYLNGVDTHIFHTAKAHTSGDAVVHFKGKNVIHSGDVFFNKLYPYFDYANGGSLDGYIAAQLKILSYCDDKTKIIPGHGELASKKDLESSIAMLKDSKQIILQLVEKGKSIEEIVKLNPLKKYDKKWSWGFISTEKMVRQVYKGIQ